MMHINDCSLLLFSEGFSTLLSCEEPEGRVDYYFIFFCQHCQNEARRLNLLLLGFSRGTTRPRVSHFCESELNRTAPAGDTLSPI